MEPITIVMISQTAIFTATLIVLIIQVRSQIKAIHLEVYSKCQSDYSSLIRMLIQQRELQTVYDDLAEQSHKTWKWQNYSEKEKLLYNYFELNYELFERVFILWKKHWIDSETWNKWDVWLDEICSHPIFEDVWRENAGMFDSAFEEYINDKLSYVNSKANKSR